MNIEVQEDPDCPVASHSTNPRLMFGATCWKTPTVLNGLVLSSVRYIQSALSLSVHILRASHRPAVRPHGKPHPASAVLRTADQRGQSKPEPHTASTSQADWSGQMARRHLGKLLDRTPCSALLEPVQHHRGQQGTPQPGDASEVSLHTRHAPSPRTRGLTRGR